MEGEFFCFQTSNSPSIGFGQYINIRFIRIVALLLLCIPTFLYSRTPLSGYNPAVSSYTQREFFVTVDSFGANTALPVQSFFSPTWSGPFHPEERNYLDVLWNAAAGISVRNWTLAMFSRAEYFIDCNKDTAEILKLINNKEELPVGRTFLIDIKSRSFSSSGLEISRRIGLEQLLQGLTAGFTVRSFLATGIQQGKITGTVVPISPKSYEYNLLMDYIYDKNKVYDRRDEYPENGYGYSLDIGFAYYPLQYFGIECLMRDIAGRIYWNKIPYTTATATSNNMEYDKDGYLIFKPTITGYESHKSMIQKIPLKTDLSFVYRMPKTEVSTTINFIEDRPLYWVNCDIHAGNDFSILTGYNFNYESAVLGCRWRNIALQIYASSLFLDETKSLGVNFSLTTSW